MNNKFSSLNLSGELLKVLTHLGYNKMSPVQNEAIPLLIKNESLLVKAPTGTGKTLAYLVPILNDLSDRNYPQAIIVLPTKVLVQQVGNVLKRFKDSGYDFTYSIVLDKMDKSSGQIILTNPKRIQDLITSVNLKYVKRVILDEGDMLILDGFIDEVASILTLLSFSKISIFTASIDENMNTLVKKYIKASKLIDLTGKSVNSSSVTHNLVNIHGYKTSEALKRFLELIKPYRTIVFASKKVDVIALDKELNSFNISHSTIYGDQDKSKQKNELRKFIDDETHILLSSDIMSRGIDISDVSDIISIDIPYDQVYYFHRAGRAGRFDAKGNSYLFYDSDDTKKVKDLMKRVDFHFYTLKKNELKADRDLTTKDKKPKTNALLEERIRREVNKVRSNKVKPNYKKKVKKAVEKAKRMHKVKIIRKNLSKKDKSI